MYVNSDCGRSICGARWLRRSKLARPPTSLSDVPFASIGALACGWDYENRTTQGVTAKKGDTLWSGSVDCQEQTHVLAIRPDAFLTTAASLMPVLPCLCLLRVSFHNGTLHSNI